VFKLSSNPVALVPRIQELESTRDRVLSDDELRHLWKALADLRTEVAHTIRCNLLLGGQRFLQLLRATWPDYDTKTQVLRLADPKGKRRVAVPHLLPVSKQVAKLLEELRKLNGTGTYIFSTTAGGRPIHHTSLPPIVRAVAQASAELTQTAAAPFQGRDIRRSMETRLQALNVSREVRAQLLSHGRTSGVQQKHYERHDYLAEKTSALRQLETHLAAVFSARPRGSHVPRLAAKRNPDTWPIDAAPP
jgi:integrase